MVAIPLCLSGFSREPEPMGCAYAEIYFQKSAYLIGETGKSNICRRGWPAGDQGQP